MTNENVSISGTTVSYILGDNDGVTLNGETQYFVSVRANCTENSVWSNEVNFTTAVACTNISSYSWATVSGITPEGAVISWNDTDHSEWLLAYSTSSSAPGIDVTTTTGNYTVVSCENSTYTFEGLNYSTTYYVWVRANCGGIDGYSRWSTYSKSFTTLVQFPAPTIASTSATPDGAVVTWNKGYEETQWQIQLGVQEGYSWTYTLVDGILDAQTYTFTGLTEQTSYRVQVRAYIDAEHQSAWSNYGSFTTLASCPKPTNLTYSDLTANSVVLDWTIGYDETAWNIQYKANGAADWTLIENITTKPYSMTVEDATTYQVQIQNTCGSDWSNIITFTTPCLPNSTFPFEEDFEGLTADKDIPNCWNNATGNTSDSYKWGYKTGSGNGSTVTNGHNGTKCIRFESYYNSAGNYNDLKTPVMNFPAGKTMVLGFWWKNPAGGDFSVYISTDGGATYTTALKSGMTGQSGWKEEEIELTDYVGAENVVVVFKGTSNCGNGNAFIYLDDVTISEKSDCAKPKDLAVSSFDNHSATLSWDANGSVSPWQVAYSTTEYFNLDDPTVAAGLELLRANGLLAASDGGTLSAEDLKQALIDVYMAMGVKDNCYTKRDDWSIPETMTVDGEEVLSRNITSGFTLTDGNRLPSLFNRDPDGKWESVNQAGIDAVKSELMRGHGVSAGFQADQAEPGMPVPETYMSTKTWAHYTYEDKGTSHMICIVGWDDDYSAANFLEGHQPPADGAWLAKNSWGSETDYVVNETGAEIAKDAWGIEDENGLHTGYFWISYYDKSLNYCESMSFDTDLADAEGEMVTQMYDYMPSLVGVRTGQDTSEQSEGLIKTANVFVNDTGFDARLLSVSTKTAKPQATVTYSVYRLGEGFENPEDGELVGTVTATYEYAGFHREKLDGSIVLKDNERFAVVAQEVVTEGGKELYEYAANISYTKGHAEAVQAREAADGTSSDERDRNADEYGVAVVNKGESYIFDGGVWCDWSEYEPRTRLLDDYAIDNFSIKAYLVFQPA